MKRIIALTAIAAAALLGAPTAAQARIEGPDVTLTQHNVIQNSGLSDTAILVTGLDVNRRSIQPENVIPRWSSRSTGYYLAGVNEPIWNPEAFSVAPGASALYRVTTPRNGGAFPWQGVEGGPNGTFVSAGNLFRFFGCTPGVDACTIQVIHTR